MTNHVYSELFVSGL